MSAQHRRSISHVSVSSGSRGTRSPSVQVTGARAITGPESHWVEVGYALAMDTSGQIQKIPILWRPITIQGRRDQQFRYLPHGHRLQARRNNQDPLPNITGWQRIPTGCFWDGENHELAETTNSGFPADSRAREAVALQMWHAAHGANTRFDRVNA